MQRSRACLIQCIVLLGLTSAATVLFATATIAQTNKFPATGNVGIGTTTPSNLLSIAGNDSNRTGIDIKNADGSASDLSLLAGGSSGFGIQSWANAAILEGEAPNGLVIGAINESGSGAGGPINFQINRTNVATISTSGNVGIGTTTPGATLEVKGNVKLTSGSGASITFADGTTQSTAWSGTLCGGDYAEAVDVTGNRTNYEPGDVLVIDADAPGKFLKSNEPYSTGVTGIFSTKPGLIGRRQDLVLSAEAKSAVPMAMIGIVPVKASAENGAIRPGDFLVTASITGYVMKGTDRTRMLGAIVGKAMANLASGTGVIEVLVSLQ